MMRKPFVFTLIAVLILALGVAGAAAQEPQSELAVANGGCVAGGTYDPACDVDHDGNMDVVDLELVATHWGQTGTWSGAASYWTQTGSDIYYDTGNVGIGTASPSAKLHVDAGMSGDGVWVQNVGEDGVYVVSAGNDGVQVYRAGNPSWDQASALHNGFEVNGAEGNGLYVGRANSSGVHVESAGSSGVAVSYAGGFGVWVDGADSGGVNVNRAGSPSTTNTSSEKNGFQVAGAEGHGLYVGRADVDGVAVWTTGRNGVWVQAAGQDGLLVQSAVRDGVAVAGNQYAGSFHGHVEITGTCTGCALAAFGRNAGRKILEPGDVIAVRSATHPELPGHPVVMDIDLATGPGAVIGVVAGRAELMKHEDYNKGEGETVQRLVPREGPAQPGEYVNIVIYGLAQVKASAATASIKPGTRLTGDSRSGHARAIRTVEVQGVQVAESAPVIGIALEKLEVEEGLIWVLVSPR